MKRRLLFAGIPVDFIPEESLDLAIQELVSQKDIFPIVFLDFRGYMRARRKADYRSFLNAAALVVPVSRRLQKGYRYLRKETLPIYMPFDFIIRLLGILEKHGWSTYLFSSRPNDLAKAAGNLRASFPGLKIIGRHAGYFSSDLEEDIILAIRKASPTLLLAGRGVPGKETWIKKHKNRLNPGLFLWCGECFDIFSGVKSRPSRKTWERSLEGLRHLLLKPWRIFRLFSHLFYWIMLTVQRIRKL